MCIQTLYQPTTPLTSTKSNNFTSIQIPFHLHIHSILPTVLVRASIINPYQHPYLPIHLYLHKPISISIQVSVYVHASTSSLAQTDPDPDPGLLVLVGTVPVYPIQFHLPYPSSIPSHPIPSIPLLDRQASLNFVLGHSRSLPNLLLLLSSLPHSDTLRSAFLQPIPPPISHPLTHAYTHTHSLSLHTVTRCFLCVKPPRKSILYCAYIQKSTRVCRTPLNPAVRRSLHCITGGWCWPSSQSHAGFAQALPSCRFWTNPEPIFSLSSTRGGTKSWGQALFFRPAVVILSLSGDPDPPINQARMPRRRRD
ncbi:hypothetical protein V8C43DRAFT_243340 [Trichoderma afarasin]